MPTVSRVLADYRSLLVPDQSAVKSAIISHIGIGTDMETFVADERFKDCVKDGSIISNRRLC